VRVTEEIWPGYRVSTAAYLTSLLQERIVRELELPRFGYQVDAKDPAFFSAFPDGRHFFMWQDRAKTLAEIAKFSRTTPKSIRRTRPARAPLAGCGRPAADHPPHFPRARSIL
jgi:phytoene dehydrogenase-like protein